MTYADGKGVIETEYGLQYDINYLTSTVMNAEDLTIVEDDMVFLNMTGKTNYEFYKLIADDDTVPSAF